MKPNLYRNLEMLNFKSKASTDAPLIVNLVNDCFSNTPPFAYDTYNRIGRDDYFLIYVTDGIFNTEINNKVLKLKKGAVVLFPPKYKYHYWGEPPSKYLCAHFTGSHVEENLIDLNFPLKPLAFEMDFSEKIKSLFEKMDEQYSTNGPFLQYSLACLLEEILLTIAINRKKSNGYRAFKESIKYIRANFTGKIHIPFLAKLEGLSNSRYITLFRKEMKKTPSEYIRELRLSNACDLLLTTNMPISLVGSLSGYGDQYFFSKIFKKHIGTSPQEYRKKHK